LHPSDDLGIELLSFFGSPPLHYSGGVGFLDYLGNFDRLYAYLSMKRAVVRLLNVSVIFT
jgi:hypothetical protein